LTNTWKKGRRATTLVKKKNGKSGKKKVCSGDDFVGWCVLNSTARQSEKKQHGFQGTIHTRNVACYGVRLFLNICASYLKARFKNGPAELAYDEPFGNWEENKGSEEFPRFDFQCPSILSQPNAHDCGLAVVANSMALVKHLKGKQFLKTNMQKQEKNNDIRFVLDEKIYSLKPFWDSLMRDGSSHQYGLISDSGDLLRRMRQEFIDIVDETAAASKTNQGHYDNVQQRVGRKIYPAVLAEATVPSKPTAAATVSYTDSDHVSDIEEVVPAGEKEDSVTPKPPVSANTTEAQILRNL
jgi:hypothetical protein